MKTVQQFEKEHAGSVGNPYFHDRRNYSTPTLNLIWVGITPKGRISRHFHQMMFYKGKKYPTKKSVYAAAPDHSPLAYGYKLPRGYSWSEPLIQHDFWR